MRRWRISALLVSLACATPAVAANLVIQKSIAVVTDLLGTLRPRIFTGSTIDYALLVTNPLLNVLVPVRRVEIVDMIDPTLKLRVLDYPGTSGPVEFVDGGPLGLGLLNGGVTYSYSAIGSTTDGLEFFDGTRWDYVPVADAQGYDVRVRGIRVKVAGTQTTGGTFRLRYRVAVR